MADSIYAVDNKNKSVTSLPTDQTTNPLFSSSYYNNPNITGISLKGIPNGSIDNPVSSYSSTTGQYQAPIPVYESTTPAKVVTPTVSSNTATSYINNKIQPAITQATQVSADVAARAQAAKDLDASTPSTSRYLLGTGQVNPNYVPPQQESLTPEQSVANAPEDGMQEAYNIYTGKRVDQPSGTLPEGYTSQNPMSRTDVVSEVDAPGSIVYKKFADGTYGRYNLTTGSYSAASSADYYQAQSIADTTKQLNDLNKGILSPLQQTQIDGLKSQYADLIEQQRIENANITGGMTIAQNMYGLGNSLIGKGEIQKTVNDGILRIQKLQDALSRGIADMTSAFQKDDVSMLQNAYNQYTTAQANIQDSIDTLESRMSQIQQYNQQKLTTYAYQQSNAHPDAGITGLESSVQEINDKVTASNTFKSKQNIVDTTPVNANRPNPEVANTPSSTTGLTPNTLWQNANDYALSGKSLQNYVGGLSSAAQANAAKDAIKNKAGALLAAAGVDMSTLQQEWKALSSAQRQQVSYLNNVDRSLDAAHKANDVIQNIFAKSNINQFDATIANQTINAFVKKFGDSSDVRAYQAAASELANEYAQVFARGGSRSVEGNRAAQDIINGNVKVSDIGHVIDTLEAVGATVVESAIDQVNKISGGYGTEAVSKYLKYIHSAPVEDISSQSTTSSGTPSSLAESW